MDNHNDNNEVVRGEAVTEFDEQNDILSGTPEPECEEDSGPVGEDEEDVQPAGLTLRKILGGDMLTSRFMRNNFWLMVLILVFMILYISNRYSIQKDLIEIDKLNVELKDAKYRALSSSSQLTEKSRESHILEVLKTGKDSVLRMSDRPPYIINVPEKNE